MFKTIQIKVLVMQVCRRWIVSDRALVLLCIADRLLVTRWLGGAAFRPVVASTLYSQDNFFTGYLGANIIQNLFYPMLV